MVVCLSVKLRATVCSVYVLQIRLFGRASFFECLMLCNTHRFFSFWMLQIYKCENWRAEASLSERYGYNTCLSPARLRWELNQLLLLPYKDKDMLCVRRWSGAVLATGSGVGKYMAERPKKGSKRFNFITTTIHFANQSYYLSIVTCFSRSKVWRRHRSRTGSNICRFLHSK